jgi:hypothetical protein
VIHPSGRGATWWPDVQREYLYRPHFDTIYPYVKFFFGEAEAVFRGFASESKRILFTFRTEGRYEVERN